MTIIESGIITGVSTGAIIGGVICKSHGIPGVIAGSLAGMTAGAAIGWLYAYLILLMLSVAGVLWRVARKRADTVPTEEEMELMTPIGVRGIFVAGFVILVCWHSFGWAYAFAAAFALASVTAILATGSCEFR